MRITYHKMKRELINGLGWGQEPHLGLYKKSKEIGTYYLLQNINIKKNKNKKPTSRLRHPLKTTTTVLVINTGHCIVSLLSRGITYIDDSTYFGKRYPQYRSRRGGGGSDEKLIIFHAQKCKDA